MSYYVREPRGARRRHGGRHARRPRPRSPPRRGPRAPAWRRCSRSSTYGPRSPRPSASRIEVSCAWSADDLAADVVDHVASFADLPSHRVEGGNQSLALAMAEQLGVAGAARGRRARGRPQPAGRAARDLARDGPVRRGRHHRAAAGALRARDHPAAPLRQAPRAAPADDGRRREAARRAALARADECRPVGPRPLLVLDGDRTRRRRAAGAQLLRRLAHRRAPAHRRTRAPGWRASRPCATTSTSTRSTAVVTTWHDDPWARGAYSADGLASAARRRRAGRRTRRVGCSSRESTPQASGAD